MRNLLLIGLESPKTKGRIEIAMTHAMEQDDSNTELIEAGQAGTGGDPGAEATPQGGRGVAISDPSDTISIEALRVFEQRGPVAEGALALCWGLPRAELRAVRQEMEEGTDWEHDGTKIVLLPRGAAKMASAFQVTDFSHFEKKAGPESADEPAAAPCFVHSAPRNPKLVLVAEKKGGPATGRLRVRDNRKFVPGMDLTGRVQLIPGHTDFYDLVGNQPRFRGRF